MDKDQVILLAKHEKWPSLVANRQRKGWILSYTGSLRLWVTEIRSMLLRSWLSGGKLQFIGLKSPTEYPLHAIHYVQSFALYAPNPPRRPRANNGEPNWTHLITIDRLDKTTCTLTPAFPCSCQRSISTWQYWQIVGALCPDLDRLHRDLRRPAIHYSNKVRRCSKRALLGAVTR